MKLESTIIQGLYDFYIKLPEYILNIALQDVNLERHIKGDTIGEKIRSILDNAQPYESNGKNILNISAVGNILLIWF